jgi:hypothetical protein
MAKPLIASIAVENATLGAAVIAQVAFRRYLDEAWSAEQRITVELFLEFALSILLERIRCRFCRMRSALWLLLQVWNHRVNMLLYFCLMEIRFLAE